ncbi:MAG: hypothetical protein KKF85_16430 [Gammaproteobacteria bacterium]|nr:hypothetical protein [Rhodocyclaceae bacterium]MBU3910779.1 hypothetical protein [Gammaproteobacteria bacterium]MBU3989400.1 hypothetical protein [Gammaproteobacteria bacterium]MBU4006233.1 hypothetical protein [Gammaproteobacteria bacterium]MBU4097840.1 hypothetical protein [Gammaproteobacteria bacterium]
MSNYDERVKEINERTMAAMHAFWSAMLTAHTVLLSVAVALPAISPSSDQWQVKLVGCLATASMFALLFNFAALRMQYEAIGHRLLHHESGLTEDQRKKDISIALWRYRLMRIVEPLVATFLVAEASLLMWVLLR